MYQMNPTTSFGMYKASRLVVVYLSVIGSVVSQYICSVILIGSSAANHIDSELSSSHINNTLIFIFCHCLASPAARVFLLLIGLHIMVTVAALTGMCLVCHCVKLDLVRLIVSAVHPRSLPQHHLAIPGWRIKVTTMGESVSMLECQVLRVDFCYSVLMVYFITLCVFCVLIHVE
jgi:hypothetical protein